MWEWHGAGMGGGFMWLFWIFIIALVVFLLKGLGSNGGSGKAEEDALEILKKRFARGEMDEKEFKQRKDTLKD